MPTFGPTELLLLALAAFAAGVVDAIGGGGGLITLPALLLAGVPPHQALATNKTQALLGTSAAAWTYRRHGLLDMQGIQGLLVAAPLGAALGALCAVFLPTASLQPLIVVMLIAASLFMLLLPRLRSSLRARPSPKAHWITLAVAGLGFYDGLFGPGAGSLSILICVLFLNDSLSHASARAKVLNLSTMCMSVSLFAFHGLVRWELSALMACANLVGGIVGARLVLRGGDALVRWSVLLATITLAGKMLWDNFL